MEQRRGACHDYPHPRLKCLEEASTRALMVLILNYFTTNGRLGYTFPFYSFALHVASLVSPQFTNLIKHMALVKCESNIEGSEVRNQRGRNISYHTPGFHVLLILYPIYSNIVMGVIPVRYVIPKSGWEEEYGAEVAREVRALNSAPAKKCTHVGIV